MPPHFVYLHRVHDYDDQDKLFFCDEEQTFLKKIPWLAMKTDNQFIPSLFLIPSFQQEFDNLFPNKETVFHFWGRYLLHPTNSVWGLITRYYQAYLAKADERIGIQIRIFDAGMGPFQHLLDQILAYTLKENILPEIYKQQPINNHSGTRTSKAVIMTSLSSGYIEKANREVDTGALVPHVRHCEDMCQGLQLVDDANQFRLKFFCCNCHSNNFSFVVFIVDFVLMYVKFFLSNSQLSKVNNH